MRLINADAVWERYNKEYRQQDIYDGADDKDWLKKCIDEAPTVDAEPVRHEKWIDDTGCLDSYKQYKCSGCGKRPMLNEMWCNELTDYCPFCGARMDGE